MSLLAVLTRVRPIQDDMAMLKAKLKKMAKINLQESEQAQIPIASPGLENRAALMFMFVNKLI